MLLLSNGRIEIKKNLNFSLYNTIMYVYNYVELNFRVFFGYLAT